MCAVARPSPAADTYCIGLASQRRKMFENVMSDGSTPGGSAAAPGALTIISTADPTAVAMAAPAAANRFS
jgi:hypothetical protein